MSLADLYAKITCLLRNEFPKYLYHNWFHMTMVGKQNSKLFRFKMLMMTEPASQVTW